MHGHRAGELAEGWIRSRHGVHGHGLGGSALRALGITELDAVHTQCSPLTCSVPYSQVQGHMTHPSVAFQLGNLLQHSEAVRQLRGILDRIIKGAIGAAVAEWHTKVQIVVPEVQGVPSQHS